MSLRLKAFCISLVIMTICLAGLSFVSKYILLDSYEKMEEKQIRHDLKRVEYILRDQINALDLLALDWANWDDTYEFAHAPTQEYITANLPDQTFIAQRLSLVLIANDKGELVYSKGFDQRTERATAIDETFLHEFRTPTSPLSTHIRNKPDKGIYIFPDGPMIICARPILTSNNRGPLRGTLVMGRKLDQHQRKKLEALTMLSIQWERVSFTLHERLREHSPTKSTLPQAVVSRPAKHTLSARTLLKDIAGHPALYLHVSTPRTLYMKGERTISTLFHAVLVLLAILSVISLLLMERHLLRRLTDLIANTTDISLSKNPQARVFVPGNDELNQLGNAINTMLASLEQRDAALRASEQKYRTMTDNLEAGISLFNTDLHVIAANKKMKQWFGQIDDSIGEFPIIHDYLQNLPPDKKPLCQVCLEMGEAQEGDLEVAINDTPRIFHILMCPIQNEEGLVTALLRMMTDETLHRLTEQQLQQALRQKALTTMLAGIAHEINNPLNTLQLTLTGLEMRLDSGKTIETDELQLRLKRASSEIHTITNIISHMRTLTGKSEVEGLQSIDINASITETCDAYGKQLDEADVNCHLALHPNLPSVRAHPLQLKQVISNLLDNAIHAFSQSAQQEKRLTIATLLEDNTIRLLVEDNGPGLNDNEKQIFDPFFSTKDVGEGMGLGLSLVQAFVSHWGGTIVASTARSGGAAFTISLPIAPVDGT